MATTPSIAMKFVPPKGLEPQTSMYVGTFDIVPSDFAGVQIFVDRVVGILLDRSGSMKRKNRRDPGKIDDAVQAVISLIEKMTESMRFLVVDFGNAGHVLVPVQQATKANKEKAIAALRKLADAVNDEEQQSTYMGSGFDLLLDEVESNCKTANTVIIGYTDGCVNDAEVVKEQIKRLNKLRQSGYSIKGHMRGIGTDWDSAYLDALGSDLQGTCELVDGHLNMAEDLKMLLAEAESQVIGDVRITLWTPKEVKVVEISQLNPVQVPLTALMMDDPADPRKVAKVIPISSLGEEPTRYFFHFELTPHPVGDVPIAAAKIGLRYRYNGQEVEVKPTRLEAVWTSDEAVYGDVALETRRALKDKDTQRIVEEADEHLRAGRPEQATIRYADALALARVQGNGELTRRLEEVVHVDRATGRVEARDLSEKATMRVRSASRRTGRIEGDAAEGGQN